jgi:hypothetical protein
VAPAVRNASSPQRRSPQWRHSLYTIYLRRVYTMCVGVADKTYSFRAPSQLSERLRRAREGFNSVTHDAELSAHLGNEFELALLKRLRKLGEEVPDGVFVRAIVEAFVGAAERVRWEEEQMEEFAAFNRDDTGGDAWRQGALRLATRRIASAGD